MSKEKILINCHELDRIAEKLRGNWKPINTNLKLIEERMYVAIMADRHDLIRVEGYSIASALALLDLNQISEIVKSYRLL